MLADAPLTTLPFLGWLFAAAGGLGVFLWLHPRRELFAEAWRHWRQRPFFLPVVFVCLVVAHLVAAPGTWQGMEPTFFPVPNAQESEGVASPLSRAGLQAFQQWAAGLHRVAPVSILSLGALFYAVWQFLMQPRAAAVAEEEEHWHDPFEEAEQEPEPRWRSVAVWLLPLLALFHAVAWIAWLSRDPRQAVSAPLRVLQYLGLPFECLIGLWLQRGLLRPPKAGPVFPAQASWFVQCLPLALIYAVISLAAALARELGPQAETWVAYWWIPQALALFAAFPWLIFHGAAWSAATGAESLRMLWMLPGTFLWLGLTALLLLTAMTLLLQNAVLAQTSPFWAPGLRAVAGAAGGMIVLWTAAAWHVGLEKHAAEHEAA